MERLTGTSILVISEEELRHPSSGRSPLRIGITQVFSSVRSVVFVLSYDGGRGVGGGGRDSLCTLYTVTSVSLLSVYIPMLPVHPSPTLYCTMKKSS